MGSRGKKLCGHYIIQYNEVLLHVDEARDCVAIKVALLKTTDDYNCGSFLPSTGSTSSSA